MKIKSIIRVVSMITALSSSLFLGVYYSFAFGNTEAIGGYEFWITEIIVQIILGALIKKKIIIMYK